MSREEAQKLLGGYATDTLSEAERHALFEAALEDQDLFDALAKEQPLREALQDPAARQQLLAALGSERPPFREKVRHWLRPRILLAFAGGMAALLGVVVVSMRLSETHNARFSTAVLSPASSNNNVRDAFSVRIFKPPPKKVERSVRLPRPPVLQPSPLQIAPPADDTNSLDSRPQQIIAEATPPPSATAPEAAQPMAGLQQDLSGPARELYDRPKVRMAKHARSVAATNLGVRYNLLLKDTFGEFIPVRLDSVFHPGDAVRVGLIPNDNGYAYLFQHDPSGEWHLGSSQQVTRGQQAFLPANDALQYDEPGRKELLLVISRHQESQLEPAELDALAAGAGKNILNAAVLTQENAYAVDTRAEPDQQKVAFQIALDYR